MKVSGLSFDQGGWFDVYEYLIDHADDIAYKAGYLTPDGGQIILNLYATEIPTITIRHEAFIEK